MHMHMHILGKDKCKIILKKFKSSKMLNELCCHLKINITLKNGLNFSLER